VDPNGVKLQVLGPVASAYYTRLIGGPDAARARASSAAAIVSTLAVGFLGSSIVAIGGRLQTAEKLLIALTIVAWAAVTILYLRLTAATGSSDHKPEIESLNPDAFVERVINDSSNAATGIDSRQRQAIVASIVALCLTSLLLAVLVLTPVSSGQMHVELSPSGSTRIAELCDTSEDGLEGRLVEGPNDSFVHLKNVSGCGEVSELVLPRTAILLMYRSD
jgi:hypothetical protein